MAKSQKGGSKMVLGAIIFGAGVLVGLLAPVGIAKLKQLIEKA